MVGRPGAGKTMIARRMPGILPPPSFEESLEITRIRSVAGLGGRLARERPFRAPHHTISAQGLVGGGSRPRPGEITLAHRGVLFLDELAEFSRAALEALRQPLEDGSVAIIRGQRLERLPRAGDVAGGVQPVSLWPQPRGVRVLRRRASAVSPQAQRAAARSDRPGLLGVAAAGATARGRRDPGGELRARARASGRRARAPGPPALGSPALCNAGMDGRMTRRHVRLRGGAVERLIEVVERGGVTGRGHDRVLRLARTIADLAGREEVTGGDLDEALGYRLGAVGEAAA